MSRFATFAKVALAVGVVLLAAGCSGKKDVAIAAKDDTIRKQEELIAKERSDKDQLTDANKALAEQNKTIAEKNGAIIAAQSAQLAQTNQKLDGLEALVKELKVAPRPADGVTDGMAYGTRNGAIVLTVAGQSLFDSGKAELKSSSHTTLMNVCKAIKSKFPNNVIRVEGHTDSTPVVHNKAKYPDNMALSVARARSVYDFMIKDGGIAAHKMFLAGYGASQPLTPEKTAADRAKNRRVEIVIMPESAIVKKEQLADAKPAPASTTARKK
jgi:chemotaxis protein MotB